MKKYIFFILLTAWNVSCTKDDNLKPHQFPADLPGKYIDAMALDSKGGLWIETSEIDTAIKLPAYSSSLPVRAYLTRFFDNSFEVYDDRFPGAEQMVFDGSDRLWFYTGKKVRCFSEGKYSDEYILPDNLGLFRWITTDRDKNVWVGGLSAPLLKIKTGSDITVENMGNPMAPLTSSTSAHFDNDNSLWIALWDNHIAKMTSKGVWTFFNEENSALPYQNFWSVVCDKDNSIWAGTGWTNAGQNLFKYDGKKWEQIAVKDDKGNAINGTIRQLYYDNSKIWMVIESSVNNMLDKTWLITFDGTKWNRIYDVPSDDGIRQIVMDLTGKKAWVGTMNNGYIELDL